MNKVRIVILRKAQQINFPELIETLVGSSKHPMTKQLENSKMGSYDVKEGMEN